MVGVSRTVIGTGNGVSSHSTFVSGRRWHFGALLLSSVLGILYLVAISLGKRVTPHPCLLPRAEKVALLAAGLGTNCAVGGILGFERLSPHLDRKTGRFGNLRDLLNLCQPEGLIAGAVPATVGPGLAGC
jgi:hypothetical protein